MVLIVVVIGKGGRVRGGGGRAMVLKGKGNV